MPDVPKLAASEVIGMYAGTEQWWRLFGYNRIAWGGGPRDETELDTFRRKVRLAQESGIRYSASLDFVTRFRDFMDDEPNWAEARCVDLASRPILVPWLAVNEYPDGKKAWWFCTNHPLYRRWLKRQAKLVAGVEADGLHIDDYLGTAACASVGGCFCEHCMNGFREYVRSEKGDRVGVDFHYGRFLRGFGVKPQLLVGEKRFALPLAVDFMKFQLASVNSFVRELQSIAAPGEASLLTANGWLPYAEHTFFADSLHAFVCELEWEAAEARIPGRPILCHKAAETLERPAIVTASGWDWAYVLAENKPGVARLWIAASYALGGFFMVPGPRQWAWTEEKGTHWYEPEAENFTDLYRFIRMHRDLFDGYRAVAPVALLYELRFGNSAAMAEAENLCLELTRRSVPFAVELSGDGFLAPPATPERLKKYGLVIYPESIDRERNSEWLEDPDLAARCMTFSGEDVDRVLPWSARMVPERALWFFPRRRPGSVVVHILNPNYDAGSDAVRAVERSDIFLPRPVVGDWRKCTLFAPDGPVRQLRITSSREGLWISLPRVGLWAVLKLER